MRESGDGRDLALAKVVARMLGVPTDDIREAPSDRSGLAAQGDGPRNTATKRKSDHALLFFITPRQPEIQIRFGCGGQKKARFCCDLN
jgi:hypothetical protein